MRDYGQFLRLGLPPCFVIDGAAAGLIVEAEFCRLVERFRAVDSDEAWDRLAGAVHAEFAPLVTAVARQSQSSRTTAAFVPFPQAIYEGYRRRRTDPDRLSLEQFQIYVAAYSWANWTDIGDWRVPSYSAARVCEFWGLDASDANVKRFERAAANLLNRALARRDYQRGTERTYSLWIPNPRLFDRIRTPEENRLSLWQANVGVPVGDNVGVPGTPSARDVKGYGQQDTDNVGVDVGDSAHMLSITYQGEDQNRAPQTESPERNAPSVPPRGETLAAGLFAQTPLGFAQTPLGLKRIRGRTGESTSKPLSTDQWAKLKDAALLFCAVVHDFYDFTPDVKHVEALLRDFSPYELLDVLWNDFDWHEPVLKNSLAHFFHEAARTRIKTARLQSDEFLMTSERTQNWEKWSTATRRGAKGRLVPAEHAAETIRNCSRVWGEVFRDRIQRELDKYAAALSNLAEAPLGDCSAGSVPRPGWCDEYFTEQDIQKAEDSAAMKQCDVRQRLGLCRACAELKPPYDAAGNCTDCQGMFDGGEPDESSLAATSGQEQGQ